MSETVRQSKAGDDQINDNESVREAFQIPHPLQMSVQHKNQAETGSEC